VRKGLYKTRTGVGLERLPVGNKKGRTIMRRKLIVCALIFLCMLAFASNLHGERIKLKVLVAPFLGYAPFFIAEEEGYFSEQGLDIEFVKMGGTIKSIPALAQGDLDVLSGDISIGILNAVSRGATIRVVADKGYIDPDGCVYNALLVRKDEKGEAEIREPGQLNGLGIAVTPKNSSEYYVEKLLKTAGLTLEDVTLKNIPHSVRLNALETGAIDVINMGEPWITRCLRSGKAALWVSANEMVPNFQYAVIFYGPSLIEKNPDAGKRFMTAYLKACRQYNEGKTERNIAIIAKHTGLEPDLVREACWSSIRTDGRIDVESVFEFQEWCVEKGWLDSVVPKDRLIDTSFTVHANRVLGDSSQ
jgi:NitT/TauT family transport system substrate-binding protein